MSRAFSALLLFAIFTSFCSAADAPAKKEIAKKARQPSPAYASVTDDPNLPRVLLIGDSISIGYTLPTRELLKGKVNVHRIPTNGGPTTNGLTNLDKWLGDQKWDVIHFNWGLHDLKYMDDKGALSEPGKGKQQVPPKQYEENLRQLVHRLKKTGAKLIWCTTTPVPEGSQGRVPGDEDKFNVVAAKIMQEEGVATNDLCAFAKPQLAKIGLPANVHYSPEGSQVLATKVAESILKALGK